MKLIKAFLITVLISVIPAALKAENWLYFLESPTGWTTEDGKVTVTYAFDKNVTWVGGYSSKFNSTSTSDSESNSRGILLSNNGTRGLNINCCEPSIVAKVKNNSDDFIYLDLGKTYILRNGEAELFQNITTMSTTKAEKEDDATKKSLAQSVMPIPPHSTKTLSFPLFDSQKKFSGYEPTIKATPATYNRTRYYSTVPQVQGKVVSYNEDNSPIIATISLAYTDTEGAEKPTRITKNFYVDKSVLLKSSKDKDIEKTGLNMKDRAWFIIWEGSY